LGQVIDLPRLIARRLINSESGLSTGRCRWKSEYWNVKEAVVMAKVQSAQKPNLAHVARKYFVSAFVVFSFAAYALHEQGSQVDAASVILPTQAVTVETRQGESPATLVQPSPTVPQIPPTVPPTSVSTGMYKDGTYTGGVADAFYGQVQVQAIIQGGQIRDVQVLNFPQDRRTSQRINSVALPYLRSEVIQAQSANIDLISGATLTSQAYIASLQSALDAARS
jgi:uncharacterized protein with FMN-binding domain